MTIKEHASLQEHSTMRLGGHARYLCEVKTEQDLLQAVYFADKQNLAIRMIGDGSNIIWGDKGFDGLIIVNQMTTIEIDDQWVTVGAGFNWDETVKHSIAAGLSGLEYLSLIPGTTGATPVQNVGAYGKEIKDVLVKLRAFDLKKAKFVTLKNSECKFGYRTSRFKTTDAGRFLITQLVFKLSKDTPKPPFYASLQKYLDDNDITTYDTKTIRNAVIAIRQSKLPDPEQIANTGSFFANPIIPKDQYEKLKELHPDIPGWSVDENTMKVSAGWLIDQAGLKGYHDEYTGMAIWNEQPLVFVNEKAKATSDLINFRDRIILKIHKQFGITLIQEPELIEYSLDAK